MCSAGIFLEYQSKEKICFIQVLNTAIRHLLEVSMLHSLCLCYQIIEFYLIYFLNKLVTTKNNKNTYKQCI
jgi:hypothetical protein